MSFASIVSQTIPSPPFPDVGSKPEELALMRAWPFGTTGLAALYGRDEESASTDGWVLLSPGAEKLPRGLRGAVRTGEAHPFADGDSVVFAARSDPRLPSLPEIRRCLASGELRAISSTGMPGLDRGRRLGYKPLRRLVIGFRDLRSSSPRPSFFAKVVHRQAETLRLLGLYHAVGGWARRWTTVRIPAPIGYHPQLRLLLWERAEGLSLRRKLARPEAPQASFLAGSTLAMLHKSPVRPESLHDRRSELATLRRWLPHAALVAGRAAALLEEAWGKLEALAVSLPAGRRATIHRDFHDGQLLIGPSGAQLLDLDTLTQGEPELDLGNFLAHLDLLALERRECPAAAIEAAFLEGYFSSGGGRIGRTLVDWYRAVSGLRLVCVHASRPKTRGHCAALAERSLSRLRSLRLESKGGLI